MATVLALDIATRTGWCLGAVGAKLPTFGSVRFASQGASHAALFADALSWASSNFKEWKPDRVVFEAPLPGSFRRGRTTANVAAILNGLPAIMQGVAHLRGIYDVRSASAKDVRVFFLGHNPKRDIAKKATVHRCKLLGWQVEDDNAGDACALWLYSCSFIAPGEAMRPTPLVSGASLAGELP
jgi:hypothetical protein